MASHKISPVPGEIGPRRSPFTLLFLGSIALLVFVGLIALGNWQVARRSWKLDLIARVDSRVHAPPAAAPGPAAWPSITASQDEYRHVSARGVFQNGADTLVQAVTEEGGGFWVLTPLRTDDGFTVLVNRGFVPSDRRSPADRAEGASAGETNVTGLLRITEPKGSFIQSNDPKAGRWYSRDIAAIAAARGLTGVAPYFIDADATPNRGGLPVGGLTVIAFVNNHLVYAITWYTLALMLVGGVVHVGRHEWHLLPRQGDDGYRQDRIR
jgi:surfeit locus 1 family protein